MTTHALLILILLGAPAVAFPQVPAVSQATATIESADVVGIDRDRLSDALRRDIAALNGAPMDRDRLAALAARIDAEQPEFAAAVRDVPQPDGRVRIVFVIARISDDEALAANINTRYIVDRIDIEGIDEDRISPTTRLELQALVGRQVDESEAGRLSEKLKTEFPDHDVSHRVSRGDETGRVRLRFVIRRTAESRWMPFESTPSKLVYHQKQGWSGALYLQLNGENNLFTIGLVGANNDDLVEEYSGYSFRLQNREAGTRRLGLSIELARYTQQWTDATLSAIAADPTLPAPYRTRLAVTPQVAFALTRHLRVFGGAAAAELDPLSAEAEIPPFAPVPKATQANAGQMGVTFERTFSSSSALRQHVATTYSFRTGTSALESDYLYRRHVGEARYEVEHGHSRFIARTYLGRITGNAPLFERFTLGDTATLRGWNKYDIAPAGGDRVAYQSGEFRHRNIAYFFDAGAVWNAGGQRQLRLSTGIGVHTEHAFVTVGVPINGDKVAGTFMVGVRF